jgi:uncharacterized protein (DUF488 family)
MANSSAPRKPHTPHTHHTPRKPNASRTPRTSRSQRPLRTLYTIGYGGFSPDEFVASLKDQKVKLLVDVRHTPRSRRPGFSKGPLARRLEIAGIGYVHIPELGVPTIWRHKVGPNFSRADLFKRYATVMLKQNHDAVTRLAALLANDPKTIHAITCVEEDPEDCHRSFLARALTRRLKGRLKVKHIRAAEHPHSPIHPHSPMHPSSP